MTTDLLRELLVRFEALPLEARALILEEPSCPAFFLITPEFPEGLPEEIGREIVRKYAHLSAEHLAKYSETIAQPHAVW
ncbi:MAG: hypothetical protein ACYDB8_10620 [Acidiferrobacterales bacterium]